ncbi:MAG: hypothetical protein ACRDTC_01075 [Pseudonocardiaceae bacterium]
MTGTDAPAYPGDPARAPLTLELLADLHAGVFDEPLATQLRRRVATDSQAGAVLAALDATVAELAELPHQRTTPIPDDVVRRLDATLATERADEDSPLETAWAGAPASPELAANMTAAVRRRRRAGWAGVAIMTAAAAMIGVLALAGLAPDTTGAPRADDALGTAIGIQSAEPFVLTQSNLHDAFNQALATQDYGALSPPQRLRNCLMAHGAAPGTTPLGGLEVILDGRRGVLLVLPTDRLDQLQLLVVTTNCSPAAPSRLATHLMTR